MHCLFSCVISNWSSFSELLFKLYANQNATNTVDFVSEFTFSQRTVHFQVQFCIDSLHSNKIHKYMLLMNIETGHTVDELVIKHHGDNGFE